MTAIRKLAATREPDAALVIDAIHEAAELVQKADAALDVLCLTTSRKAMGERWKAFAEIVDNEAAPFDTSAVMTRLKQLATNWQDEIEVVA